MTSHKKTIAVFFGGRSPEHDVSVVTGLQAMGALDPARYDSFAVYVDPQGRWWTGEALHMRENYMIGAALGKTLQGVTLDVRPAQGPNQGKGRLISDKGGLFGKAAAREFDVALLAFHGGTGESGAIQGILQTAEIPFTGPRVTASSLFMDKVLTKHVMRALDIPTLPFALLNRPAQGYLIPADALQDAIAGLDFPMILKPVHMGSSIGIAKVNTLQELAACLPRVFEWDEQAMVEPFVQNLVEYNIAVRSSAQGIQTSAIERPKSKDELLDFKQKYLAGGGTKGVKGGVKAPGQRSEGMLSLTREINPPLPAQAEANIRQWAARIFAAAGPVGAPRIDFISNGATGEIWMNEVNPIPGSFGYFLWEAAAPSLLFSELLDHLLEEAGGQRRRLSLPADPVPGDAHLFERKAGP